MFQLYGHRFGVAQGTAAKEIHGLIMIAQQIPFLVFHDGRQLMQVADHEQLNAAKGFVTVTVTAQHIVNGIEHISTYHTDFINHQQIKALDQANFFARKPPLPGRVLSASRQKRPKRQLKKRVDGHATCINGGYTSGRYHDHAFGRLLLYLV